ncbi:MAG: DUF5713 family protein [Desulfobacteraceae bacterium]
MTKFTDQRIEQLNLLKDMYQDGYFPNHLVDRIKTILI